MKFSTILSVASVLAAASAFKLKVESRYAQVDGNFVSAIHEGAAIEWATLGESGVEFGFDEEHETLTYDLQIQNVDPFPLSLTTSTAGFKVLAFGSGDVVTASFLENGSLAVNGDADNFYAAKDISDPYNFSQRSYFVVYSPDKDLGTPIVLVKSE